MAADFNQIIPRAAARKSASPFLPDVFSSTAMTGRSPSAATVGQSIGDAAAFGDPEIVSYCLRQQQLERLSYDQQDPLPVVCPR